MVHRVNEGWTVAKRLLQYERTSIGGIGNRGQKSESLEALVKRCVGQADDGRIDDPALRGDVLKHRMNDRSFALTMKLAGELASGGRAPGAESSMFKYYGTEQNKNRYELMLRALGSNVLGWGGAAEELETAQGWLRSKANSIEGGTSEVQLNIIAKRVLGLPD